MREYEAGENFFRIGIARKIVVCDKEAVNSLGQVAADDLLDIVGRAAPRFPALHIDDGAKRTEERAAAAGIEAGQLAAGAFDARCGKNGHGGPIQRRQIFHVVVERLERALPGVAQHRFKAPFGLAGEKRNAQIHGLFEFGRQLRRQAAGDMKAAHANLDTGSAQLAGQVHGARILIRLHTHQGY